MTAQTQCEGSKRKERCGDWWRLSEADTHPFWRPSLIRPSWHFLPTMTNCPQKQLPGFCQLNNKFLHVWHFLFLQPSVQPKMMPCTFSIISTVNSPQGSRTRPSTALPGPQKLPPSSSSHFIVSLGKVCLDSTQNKCIFKRINNKASVVCWRGLVKLNVHLNVQQTQAASSCGWGAVS